MEALKIEILKPKAMQLIRGMQELNLIRVSENPETALKSYLLKMRRNSKSVPGPDAIARVVDEVRTKRYAKK
jgi:hypothetical protein